MGNEPFALKTFHWEFLRKDSFPWHEQSCFKSILAASLVGDHVLKPSLVSPGIALFEGVFGIVLERSGC
jgi:hypothetical protein